MDQNPHGTAGAEVALALLLAEIGRLEGAIILGMLANPGQPLDYEVARRLTRRKDVLDKTLARLVGRRILSRPDDAGLAFTLALDWRSWMTTDGRPCFDDAAIDDLGSLLAAARVTFGDDTTQRWDERHPKVAPLAETLENTPHPEVELAPPKGGTYATARWYDKEVTPAATNPSRRRDQPHPRPDSPLAVVGKRTKQGTMIHDEFERDLHDFLCTIPDPKDPDRPNWRMIHCVVAKVPLWLDEGYDHRLIAHAVKEAAKYGKLNWATGAVGYINSVLPNVRAEEARIISSKAGSARMPGYGRPGMDRKSERIESFFGDDTDVDFTR